MTRREEAVLFFSFPFSLYMEAFWKKIVGLGSYTSKKEGISVFPFSATLQCFGGNLRIIFSSPSPQS